MREQVAQLIILAATVILLGGAAITWMTTQNNSVQNVAGQSITKEETNFTAP